MKVCLINTSDSGGGAAIACSRLLKALRVTIDVNMAVQDKSTTKKGIVSMKHKLFGKLVSEFNFLLERMPFIIFYEKNKSQRFAFSTASTGSDICKDKDIIDASILHLHWVNRGFLSINSLTKLLKLKKPVVWTLHDMWAFTGGCHYSGDCNHFLNSCGNCPILRNPRQNDLSKRVWLAKEASYRQNKDMVIVACSEWMASMARKSSLMKNFKIIAIPNPIDTNVYRGLDRKRIRKRWRISEDAQVILFGAANINDQRKGIGYLVKAIEILKLTPKTNRLIEVVFFGKNTQLDISALPFPVKALPLIKSEQELVEVYNLADVFVLPSLEDNLPNMVLEALACSIPVVAFNQGGIPEMIDHQQNGYIADFKSANDLAHGISWVLSQESALLKNNALKKVKTSFSEDIVAKKYIKLYQSLLK